MSHYKPCHDDIAELIEHIDYRDLSRRTSLNTSEIMSVLTFVRRHIASQVNMDYFIMLQGDELTNEAKRISRLWANQSVSTSQDSPLREKCENAYSIVDYILWGTLQNINSGWGFMGIDDRKEELDD